MTERVDAGVMATWWGVRPRWSTTGGHRRAAEGSRGVGAGRNLAGQWMAPDQPGRTAGCRRRPSGDFLCPAAWAPGSERRWWHEV